MLGAAINGVTDNPLIFGSDILSGGNFHAEPLALLSDYLAIAVAEIASMSERRTDLLDRRVNPALSMFLTTEPGLESGFMIAHVAAAALTSENRTLAHPASVDNVTTSAGQEDHVSMAPWAGFKLQRICSNTANVLAIEVLAAAHAIDKLQPLQTTEPSAAGARAHSSQRGVSAVRSPARSRHRGAGRTDRTPRADGFRDMSSDAVVLLIALFGLLLLALACQRLFRARFVAAAGSGMMGALLLAGAALFFVVSLNLHTYNRLTYEQPVAEIVFEARGPQHFRATLAQVPSGELQMFMLAGDEWQLDARVLKWKGWANLLGLDAQYRLERVSGRYRDDRAGAQGRTHGLRAEREPRHRSVDDVDRPQALAAVRRCGLRQRRVSADGRRGALRSRDHAVGTRGEARERRRESGGGKLEVAVSPPTPVAIAPDPHPRAVFAPLVRMPRILHGAEHALRMRHQDRHAAVGRREAVMPRGEPFGLAG